MLRGAVDVGVERSSRVEEMMRSRLHVIARTSFKAGGLYLTNVEQKRALSFYRNSAT